MAVDRARTLLLFLGLLVACDEARRPTGSNPGVRRDASTSDGSAAGGDGSLLDAAPVPADAGGSDGGESAPDAGSADAGSADAGPCNYPASQGLSQPCCFSLGIDACGAQLFCEAFDGRMQPTCYAERSRQVGQTCSADIQCSTERCSPSDHTCALSPRFDTAAKILSYLDQKTLLETGADLPSHPFGIVDNVNYGAASQCYSRIVLTVMGGVVHNRVTLGTLGNAPNPGDQGTCDHNTASSELAYSSTALSIDHVSGDGACFDIDVTYPAFGTVGRGTISADGRELRLELYFQGQATGQRCADGQPGAATVSLSGTPFSGDAVQIFRVSP